MNRKYVVFLKDGNVKTIEADSFADLIEKLKRERVTHDEVAMVWLHCGMYNYHWR